MNLEEITQLSKSLTIADLLPYIEETRNTGKAVIPAEIFCAIQIAGYIRFKLNGENVFVTTERVGRSCKMYLRFHNGRAVSRKDFASVVSETPFFAILETSDVPYGKEPTVVSYVRGHELADSIVAQLFARYTDRYFETIEKDEVEVEGLPFANVYTVDAPYTFQIF
jgi:hypothetical protein